MRRTVIKSALGLLTMCVLLLIPTALSAAAFGLGVEGDLSFLGSAQLQWSTVTSSDKHTYALFGKTGVIPSIGLNGFYIHNRNVFLGAALAYSQGPGEFQTPRFGPERAVEFREEALIVRIGYIDYYYDPTWNFSAFDPGVLPANPFGHVRFGIRRSDISGAPDFADFEPAWIMILGIEMGGLFAMKEKYYLVLSGFVDYTIAVVPYKAFYPGERQEILNNILSFNLSVQFGVVSDGPR